MPTDNETVIRVSSIEKTFGENHVLNGLSLSVNKGEVISVIGPSGCGKSTLLMQLAFCNELDGRKFWFNNIIKQEAEKLVKLVKDDKIKGISDLRDESDREESVRIAIDLKKDADCDNILNYL